MRGPVNLANVITVIRLFLAPLYVVAYALIDISPIAGGLETLIAVLWALFIVMEITDVLDGMVARRQNIVTDLGKVLDPFADVVCRLTYFVILTVAGIVPLWFVMIVLYRELASVFLRLLFVREGIALGAGTAGKLKSWFYSVAAAAALFLFTADRLPGLPTRVGDALPAVRWAALAVYAIAAFLALWSIGGYIAYYARHRRGGSAGEPQNRGGSRA